MKSKKFFERKIYVKVGEMKLEKRVEKWLKDTSKILDISGLELHEWPNVLKGKENLITKLDCDFNELTSLPLLHNLTKLWCSNNQLTSLPLFPNLTYLRCSFNQLTSLPLFPNLTYLLCNKNQLTFLPVFPNLTKLWCNYNQLTSLPLFPNLTKLWCNHNKLTTGSLCVTSLPLFPKLTYLDCSFNQLTSLPLLPNLINLHCSHNKLTFLPLFPNLASLWCSDNQLTSLPLFPNLTLFTLGCNNNNLFSTKISFWKKVWRLKNLRSNEKRKRGLKRVVKVLKNRLYLPRLNQLKQELVYSPNHPGKFYKDLRVGNWSFETKKPKKLTNLSNIDVIQL